MLQKLQSRKSLVDSEEGFEQYEISNFCKPGHYSRHNSNYWRGVKYLGVGPSAHSFNGTTRQWNIANNAKYIAAITVGNLPAEQEVLTGTNRLNEYIMTALRTHWGISLDKLDKIAAGAAAILLANAQKHINEGNIIKDNSCLKLSRQGKLYADNIAAGLFFDEK